MLKTISSKFGVFVELNSGALGLVFGSYVGLCADGGLTVFWWFVVGTLFCWVDIWFGFGVFAVDACGVGGFVVMFCVGGGFGGCCTGGGCGFTDDTSGVLFSTGLFSFSFSRIS